MKIITIEEHIAFKDLTDETEKYINNELTERMLNQEFKEKYYTFSKGLSGLYDIDERFQFMENKKELLTLLK